MFIGDSANHFLRVPPSDYCIFEVDNVKTKPFKREVLKRHIGAHKKITLFEGEGQILRGIKVWGRAVGMN